MEMMVGKYPVKTMIYISKEQKKYLDMLAYSMKKSIAQLIREAIDSYTKKKKLPLNFVDIVNITAGAWKDRKDVVNGISYENTIRKSWRNRLKRELSG